jgi:hypothetical protein
MVRKRKEKNLIQPPRSGYVQKLIPDQHYYKPTHAPFLGANFCTMGILEKHSALQDTFHALQDEWVSGQETIFCWVPVP